MSFFKVWMFVLILLVITAIAIVLGRLFPNRKTRSIVRTVYAVIGASVATVLLGWWFGLSIFNAVAGMMRGSCGEAILITTALAILLAGFLYGCTLYFLVDISANYRRQDNQRQRSSLRRKTSIEDIYRAKRGEAVKKAKQAKAAKASKAPRITTTVSPEPKKPQLSREQRLHINQTQLSYLLYDAWRTPFATQGLADKKAN